MMKFEPIYAYNDRLVLFPDIKKNPKQNKQTLCHEHRSALGNCSAGEEGI